MLNNNIIHEPVQNRLLNTPKAGFKQVHTTVNIVVHCFFCNELFSISPNEIENKLPICYRCSLKAEED